MLQPILMVMQKWGAPNLLNIHNYEQCQCDQLAGTSGIDVGALPPPSLLFTPLVLFAYLREENKI